MAPGVLLWKMPSCFCTSTGMSGTQMTRPMNVIRLLGDRLKLGKDPKLPLSHLDFADLVIEHPASQHGETASFGIGEHRLRQNLPH